jgi:hypothetical protein
MEKIIYAFAALRISPEELDILLTGLPGLSGSGLFAVNFKDISAITGNHHKKPSGFDTSRAIEYAGIVESLARHLTVLPMRFGSLMPSADAIRLMLERNYVDISANLQKVEDKCEFGLKIFCDSEKLQAELNAAHTDETNGNSLTLPEKGISVFREYVNRKLQVHRQEELRLKYVESVIAEVSQYLTGLNTIGKFRKMVTDANLVDALFLLDNDKKDLLIQSVANLQSQYPVLTFILTGPWPPYSFVEIAIK